MIISSEVPPQYNDFSLIDYLSSRFTYLTRDKWCSRIDEGRVSCNARVADQTVHVKAGDTISYDMPEFKEPPADLNYSIVYEDDWILGIDKPGNLLVHHKGKSFKSNLIYQLRYVHEPAYETAGVVNRLDRETSGVVVVAKERETLVLMNKLFAQRQIRKEYLAIVHGIPEPSAGIIDHPIGKLADSKVSYKHGIHGKNAKNAITQFETVSHINNNCSLVRLNPETGRTHQLRVHMHALGHTIVGDKLYGLSDDEFLIWQKTPDVINKKMIFPRLALHCKSLSFIHPCKKEQCTITADLPQDMQGFLNK